MQRQNPLPIFFLFFALVAISTASSAQVNSETESERVVRELDRIEDLTSHGPNYKNPRAAGRLLIINRAAPTLPPIPMAARLTGPAYKNRGPVIHTTRTTTVRQPKRERLIGPRYKNRGAKSGNL
ncbi:hypothetical protein [Lewinella sp. IMCC34191]|uniref:hypothetical protein n=1 Tax=Lewinella sp. IMCC34191 TaxID=2259172 RepID=UPI000E250C6F|nr:hypothetical protein [Lewinella sp. IMCC34191]